MKIIANPFAVECPYCGAPRNRPCRSVTGKPAKPHSDRFYDAETERLLADARAKKHTQNHRWPGSIG